MALYFMPSFFAGFRSKVLIPFVAILIACLSLSAQAGETTIEKVQALAKGKTTAISLIFQDLDKAEYFLLNQPPRLVINVPSTRWAVARADLETKEGILDGLRFAHNTPKQSRLVFDLESYVSVRVAKLEATPQGDRLTLGLKASSALTPLGVQKIVKQAASPDAAQPKAEEPLALRKLAKPATSGLAARLAPLPTQKPQSISFLPAKLALAKTRAQATAAKVVGADCSGRQTAFRPKCPNQNLLRAAYQPKPKPTSKLSVAKQRPVIVIDAGHGGKDPGTQSKDGLYEKIVALQVSIALARKLEATGRYEVRLTRSDDYYLTLDERVALAATMNGDYFVSVHADHHRLASTRGATIYTLSEKSSDNEAEMAARRENGGKKFGLQLQGVDQDATEALVNLGLQAQTNKAHKAAKLLVDHLRSRWPLHKKPIKSAGFRVLKSTEMPSLLLEVGYMSNKTDLAMMREPYDQNRLAGLLAKGIDAYFK